MSTKPISPQKLAANRRNAKKSTGPKTPDGKARASRNAIKHGLLARSIILHDNHPDERTADFENLLDQLITDLRPSGALERLLVERVAVSYWRLRRAHRFEVNSIRGLRDGTKNPTAHLVRELTGHGTPPADFVLPSNADLDKLVRYESMIDRELNRTLAQLHRLQRARTKPLPDPDIPPSSHSIPSPLPNEPTPSSAHQCVRNPESRSAPPPARGIPLAKRGATGGLPASVVSHCAPIPHQTLYRSPRIAIRGVNMLGRDPHRQRTGAPRLQTRRRRARMRPNRRSQGVGGRCVSF